MSICETLEERARRRKVAVIIGAPLAANKAEATLQMWKWLCKLYPGSYGSYEALEQAVLKLGSQCPKEEHSELEALLGRVQKAARERYAELGEPLLRYWQAREEASKIARRLLFYHRERLTPLICEMARMESFGFTTRGLPNMTFHEQRMAVEALLYGEALLWLRRDEDEPVITRNYYA